MNIDEYLQYIHDTWDVLAIAEPDSEEFIITLSTDGQEFSFRFWKGLFDENRQTRIYLQGFTKRRIGELGELILRRENRDEYREAMTGYD